MGKYTRLGFTILVLAVVGAIGGIVQHNRTKAISCLNCNVIIVGYDTVGAKHISSLGYSRNTTPELDKLAASGFSFKNDYAPAPWTVPSFMALFTSRYPTQHKVVNKYTTFNSADPNQQVISNLTKLSPKTQTLAEQFKSRGYITGGFTGDSGVSAKFGYSNGFDTYYETPPFGSIGDASTEALSWLKNHPRKKFFMFLHGYDAHGQYKSTTAASGGFVSKDYKGKLTGTPLEEAGLREKQLSQKLNLSPADNSYLNAIYDNKIKDGDAKFGAFWKKLQDMGIAKNTIVIIVGDHGEEWGEHGGVDHGHSLYNELVHVPLVFNIPGAKAHKPFNEQVSSLDIAPTVLALTGVKPSSAYASQMQGKSLLPMMENRTSLKQDIFLETDYLDATHIRGVQTVNGWKYIITEQTGKEELYNIKNDPGEKKNVINVKDNSTIAQELRLKVRNHLISMGDDPDKQWTTGCLPVYPTECK